jgi:hypothetical protein
LLADADGLTVGDVFGDGVGLTDFVGCGLPAGLGDVVGGCTTRLGCGVGLGCGLPR